MRYLIAIGVVLCMLLGPIGPLAHADTYEISEKHLIVTSQIVDEDLVAFISLIESYDLKKGDTLKIDIACDGGRADAMVAIAHQIFKLKKRGVKIVTETMGRAYSAAALLWIVGDERITHEGDIFMFHTSVIFDSWGNMKTKKDLHGVNRWIIEQFDYIIRQCFLNILHDTELVNKLLNQDGNIDDPRNGNMNWFTAEEVYKLGIATEYIELM